MRRPPQLGHSARLLQENGTSRSKPHPTQRNRANPVPRAPHCRNLWNSCSTMPPGQALAVAEISRLRPKRLEVVAHDLKVMCVLLRESDSIAQESTQCVCRLRNYVPEPQWLIACSNTFTPSE